MKFLVVLAVSVAMAAAAVNDESGAPILKSQFDSSPEGNFGYAYETGNGIYGSASGSLKAIPDGNPAVVIAGESKYTSPEGEVVQFSYTADENGYQPVGSHIPVPPPIPEPIARALAYIAAHPPPPSKY